MKKALLLSSSYEVLQIINERKIFKLLSKDKVEIISTWNEVIKCGNSHIKYPSILKLINPINKFIKPISFSRNSLILRDKSTCQYCLKKLSPNSITIDHILPKSRGGKSSFLNCVISCLECNSKKDNKTPEEANMKLNNDPFHPSFSHQVRAAKEEIHKDWEMYLT